MIQDGGLAKAVAERYAGWDQGLGADIMAGRTSLTGLARLARDRDLRPQPRSGRQEYLENLVNRYYGGG